MGQEAACALGDGRLERRMQQMMETMCKRPAASLSQLLPSEADLEAVYRFLGNDSKRQRPGLEQFSESRQGVPMSLLLPEAGACDTVAATSST